MLRLIIACNYCIHIFIILFSIFIKHLPYIGYYLRYYYTCTGSVEAEEVSLRQALMYNVSLRLFPKLALPKYSNRLMLCDTLRPSKNIYSMYGRREYEPLNSHSHVSRVYTRESDNVTTTKRPCFSIRANIIVKDYR